MIEKANLFTQFGGGREGFWDEEAWFAVLRTLREHEGEPYTQSGNPQLFEDLETALRPVNARRGDNAKLSASGQDESRSIFRAAGDIWVDTHVARFEGGEIHVSDDGAQVLDGSRTYTECLRTMFATYRERRNGKNPFIPILRLVTARQTASFEELFDAVQLESTDEMGAWLNTAQIPGFPYKTSINEANPTRSLNLILRLLARAELIEKGPEPGAWQVKDAVAAQEVVEAYRAMASSSSPTATPADALDVPGIVESIRRAGWAFEPWQIAAFCHAVRTKPFVILAGISGTGKTKLPHLIADATDSEVELIPVRPDWRDSSDVLGYTDLVGKFHAGPLLRIAHKAIRNPDRQFFAVLDEMNLARVEYYFAEVLSKLEDRVPVDEGGYRTTALLTAAMDVRDEDNEPGIIWKEVYIPPNLAIIGSVNMDETTHGFSRKVLDRSFVIEFSEVNLEDRGDSSQPLAGRNPHASHAWRQQALRLDDHPQRADPLVADVIGELTAVNEILSQAQLQVGYRVRDEVALFCLEAEDSQSMTTSGGGEISALDLVLCMKILPRIQGGGARIKTLLTELSKWAGPTDNPRLPICSGRISMLQSRLKSDGFTNFWL